ncbi:MAG: FecR domain-containing protein, partial [Chloroflexota bacterium]|nr:FecR domain-containing protein [Chloroflexota bacterium]
MAVIAVALLAATALAIRTWVFPPPSAIASTSILSVISGEVLVQEKGADDPRPGVDGETIHVGDRVITGPDSRAVLTFFEGSTQELEPNTDITIQQLDDGSGGGGIFISIKQELGTTWNRVRSLGDTESQYEVETPAGAGTVRGTTFLVTVQSSGVALYKTSEGILVVSGHGQQVEVGAGMETIVVPGEFPAPVRRSPSPLSEITLQLASPASMLVVDPSGLAVGVMPPGVDVDQIPGALSTASSVEPQSITLTEVKDGRYLVFLYPKPCGDYRLTVRGAAGGRVVFEESFQGYIGEGERWRTTLDVELEDGKLVGGELARPARTDSNPPANVVLLPTVLETVERVGALACAAVAGFPTPAPATPRPSATSPPTPTIVREVLSAVMTPVPPTVTPAATTSPTATPTPSPIASPTPTPTP